MFVGETVKKTVQNNKKNNEKRFKTYLFLVCSLCFVVFVMFSYYLLTVSHHWDCRNFALRSGHKVARGLKTEENYRLGGLFGPLKGISFGINKRFPIR